MPFVVAVWCLHMSPRPIVGCCGLAPPHASCRGDLSRCPHPGPSHVIGRGERWLGPISKPPRPWGSRDVCFNFLTSSSVAASRHFPCFTRQPFACFQCVHFAFPTPPAADSASAFIHSRIKRANLANIRCRHRTYATSSSRLWVRRYFSLSKFSMRRMQFERACK